MAVGDRVAADDAASDVTLAAETVAKALTAPAELYQTCARPSMTGSLPLIKHLADDLAGPDGELLLATLVGSTPAE